MRVVSGIQPTGNLHLGNYLGAIRNWVRMQDAVTADGAGECLFFLADLHAITVHIPADELIRNTRDMAAALIASGIDPVRSIVFNQARVPEHAELGWLLFCTARIGWLNRMTQFKEKSGKNREGASVGLYAYPVLQAADVLLYNGTHVPVGDDQKQHLELARDIAAKFNTDTGRELFTLPEAIVPPDVARIMSLRDGTSKMSKSDPSDMSRINLTDDADTIMQKIRKAKTDPEPLPASVDGLADRPEARNLVAVMAAIGDDSMQSVLDTYGGGNFGPFKAILAERLAVMLTPIRERYEALRQSAEIDQLLEDGAERAAAIARPTLAAAYDALGLARTTRR